jgi:prepilin-type N-terminal cleavage/methylation domain-containing protein
MLRMDSRRNLLRRALGQAGYTLMETLVVMSILLIVIGALADGFTSATKTETDQTARADDQEAARQALDRLRKDIHCASAAQVTPNANGETLNLTVNPGYCVAVTAGEGAGVGGGTSDGVQWCTVPIGNSGTRYGLYRTVVHACDAADEVFQVDYVTQPNVWTPACGPNSSHLQAIAIDLPVNRDIATRPGRTYRLTDRISLRNDTASSGQTFCQNS